MQETTVLVYNCASLVPLGMKWACMSVLCVILRVVGVCQCVLDVLVCVSMRQFVSVCVVNVVFVVLLVASVLASMR